MNTKTNLFVALILFMVCQGAVAQGFINLSKEKSKSQFDKYIKREKSTAFIQETDSSMTLFVRDTLLQHLDVVLHFNNVGSCDIETIVASCDSCLKKYLQVVLTKRRLGWTQLNENTYVSKYSKKMILKTSTNSPYGYTIRYNDIRKKEYKALFARL